MLDEEESEVSFDERFAVETFATMMMNTYGDDIEDYDEIVKVVASMCSYSYSLKKLN